jgi:hypothetical protein
MRYAAALLALSLAFPALAQENCQTRLESVQKAIAETPMPATKEAQIKALLEQAQRACRENDEVVAQAGIDQVQAIIDEQKKQQRS